MKTTYRVAINWLHNSYVLCNELPSLDPSVTENLGVRGHAEMEIYQYYISDCTASDITFLQKNFPDLVFTYSEALRLYVLCVDMYGTNWAYCMTECRLPQAERECGAYK